MTVLKLFISFLCLVIPLSATSHGGHSSHSSHSSHSTPHTSPHIAPHVTPNFEPPHYTPHIYMAPHPYRPIYHSTFPSTNHIILYWFLFRPHGHSYVSPSGLWTSSSDDVDWSSVGWLTLGCASALAALGLSVWSLSRL